MQNDDFIDENLDNAGSASDNNTVHKNLDLDVVLAEITAFAENMHTKNQHKKKICLRCMMILRTTCCSATRICRRTVVSR